ncbi:MAG TPA: molybdopterin dinucleotide binding domain-containing protein, partial [Candidatus Bathyarchaeia archaeon]|nr:molybdopterin dinucleotide binding domain-containing protein [Candidatus Bathyarchaeia archaeon]
THTQWNNLPWLDEVLPPLKPFLEINPIDAQARGISNGDTVTVFNDRGSIQLLARITNGMRPGVVNSYQGDQLAFPNSTVNMLTHQLINPAQSVVYLFQSNTAYFDVLVDVKGS